LTNWLHIRGVHPAQARTERCTRHSPFRNLPVSVADAGTDSAHCREPFDEPVANRRPANCQVAADRLSCHPASATLSSPLATRSHARGAGMTLNSYAKDGILTVLFMDARILDETKLEELGKDLIDLINKTSEDRVILDFRNVQFMSSSMLGKLVLVQKKCKEFKAQLKLCGISSDIREVFKITKLDKLFDIESDEAAARKAYMKRGWFG
jgi:anti-sigma B factor antagonist